MTDDLHVLLIGRNEILTMIRELHEIKKLEKYASMPISQGNR